MIDSSPLADLLRQRADTRKAAWWSDYVKGARFLGVPMAETRSIALEWWDGLDDAGDPVDTCLDLGRHRISEVRLAGIAIMEHRLVPGGDLTAPSLERVRGALDDGAYDDWNTCDWLCVKVLGPLLSSPEPHVHADVLAWSASDTLWTRRASVVAFVNLIGPAEPSPGFDEAFASTAGLLLEDGRRFVQTAVGWTMRMFATRRPREAAAFLEDHIDVISREALDNATKGLPDEQRSALRALHRSR
jgi:3-methyladenine DNA glycosylase AlkD